MDRLNERSVSAGGCVDIELPQQAIKPAQGQAPEPPGRQSGKKAPLDEDPDKKRRGNRKHDQTEPNVACADFLRRASLVWIPGHADFLGTSLIETPLDCRGLRGVPGAACA
jgi:hypothetical protein